MRIIGGHDYYDSVLGIVGRDEDICLVRNEPTEIPWRDFPVLSPFSFSRYDPYNRVEPIKIIVAGKLYTCVKVVHYRKGGVTPTTHFFYDEDRFHTFIDAELPDWRRTVRFHYNRISFERHLSQHEIDRLISMRIVTAICDPSNTNNRTWYVNGDKLKDYQLIKVLNPFNCFQDIAEWIGSRIPRNPNPMVEITDDKVKAAKHGFDKFSFRRGKQK